MAESMNNGSPYGTAAASTSDCPSSSHYTPRHHLRGRKMNFAGVVMVKEPTFCLNNDIDLLLDPTCVGSPGWHNECSAASPTTPHTRLHNDDEAWRDEHSPRTRSAQEESDESDAASQPGNRRSGTSPIDSILEQYNQPSSAHDGLSSSQTILSNDTLDSLAVDDEAWTYDFTEFLGRWRMQQLSALSRGQSSASMPSPDLAHPVTKEQFRGRHHDSTHDLQGIEWTSMNTTRQAALDARQRLYPFQQQSAQALASRTDCNAHHVSEEYHYRFRSFIPKAKPPRFSHCQLRSMLVANTRSEIYYSSNNQILRTSLANSSECTPILDLSTRNFRISTLALSPPSQSQQYLIAGSFDGEYALHLPSTTTPTQISHLSTSPNSLINHISLPDSPQHPPTAIFATNNSQLHHLDLPTNTPTKTLTYPHAINATTPSPDSRLRILVGDSDTVLLTSASTGQVLAEMQGHDDDVFTAAWSGDGYTIATGAEDGVVKIWDARNLRGEVESVECRVGCARGLEFTERGVLVVVEGEDGVTFWEGRGGKRQDGRFFGCVTGLAVLDGGEEVVVGVGDKRVGGLLTFERAERGFRGSELGGLCI